jgi:hypothetical protein
MLFELEMSLIENLLYTNHLEKFETGPSPIKYWAKSGKKIYIKNTEKLLVFESFLKKDY